MPWDLPRPTGIPTTTLSRIVTIGRAQLHVRALARDTSSGLSQISSAAWRIGMETD